MLFGQHGVFTSRDKKLLEAVRSGNRERAEAVLRKNKGTWKAAASADALERGTGYAALHYAAKLDDAAMAQMLLDYAADPNIGVGETPLFTAAKYGADSVAALLLHHDDIDVNMPNSKGDLPVHEASRAGNLTVLQRLSYWDRTRDGRSVNPMLNCPNRQGKTPLHLAVENRKMNVAQFLLATVKVDDTVRDKQYRTAYDVAQETQFSEYVLFADKWSDLVSLTLISTSEERKRRSISKAETDRAIVADLEAYRYGQLYTCVLEQLVRQHRIHYARQVLEEEQRTIIAFIANLVKLCSQETEHLRKANITAAQTAWDVEQNEHVLRRQATEKQMHQARRANRVLAKRLISKERRRQLSGIQAMEKAEREARIALMETCRGLEKQERYYRIFRAVSAEAAQRAAFLLTRQLVQEWTEAERSVRMWESISGEMSAVAESKLAARMQFLALLQHVPTSSVDPFKRFMFQLKQKLPHIRLRPVQVVSPIVAPATSSPSSHATSPVKKLTHLFEDKARVAQEELTNARCSPGQNPRTN